MNFRRTIKRNTNTQLYSNYTSVLHHLDSTLSTRDPVAAKKTQLPRRIVPRRNLRGALILTALNPRKVGFSARMVDIKLANVRRELERTSKPVAQLNQPDSKSLSITFFFQESPNSFIHHEVHHDCRALGARHLRRRCSG